MGLCRFVSLLFYYYSIDCVRCSLARFIIIVRSLQYVRYSTYRYVGYMRSVGGWFTVSEFGSRALLQSAVRLPAYLSGLPAARQPLSYRYSMSCLPVFQSDLFFRVLADGRSTAFIS
jgi:hypothetical protein